MQCHICEALLKPEEVKQHPITGKFEPCAKCLTISYETFKGYDNFNPTEEDDLSDAAINKIFKPL